MENISLPFSLHAEIVEVEIEVVSPSIVPSGNFTCMVLKANDRRTSCPCHDEFRGPRSDYVRQKTTALLEAEAKIKILNKNNCDKQQRPNALKPSFRFSFSSATFRFRREAPHVGLSAVTDTLRPRRGR
ncbi:hypothetical protein TNCV_3751481 [Trichonephila clavipes]|nr:hypothetical protein TNCV_3751481 [Trichonephila clavipes]